MSNWDITIRAYRLSDKAEVRKICGDTAFMGESVERFFADRKTFADAAISYYTDYEPESLFIAEKDNSIVGYLAGCKDTRRFKKIISTWILPKIVLTLPLRNLLFKKKNWEFLINLFKSFLKGEMKREVSLRDLPAHLHINVDSRYRNLGVGFRLMEKYLEYLKKNNIDGLHLYSFSATGQQFFKKLGFSEIASQKVSYFDYLGESNVYVSCFAKKL